MTDVTQILSQIESGDPSARRAAFAVGLRRAAEAGRTTSWPTRSPGRHCRPRRWCMRRISGSSTASRPSIGTAAVISSPPLPRRCGGFWSRTARRKKSDQGWRSPCSGSTSKTCQRIFDSAPDELLAVDEALDEIRGRRSTGGRRGEAALVQRPDDRRSGRPISASTAQPLIAIGLMRGRILQLQLRRSQVANKNCQVVRL